MSPGTMPLDELRRREMQRHGASLRSAVPARPPEPCRARRRTRSRRSVGQIRPARRASSTIASERPGRSMASSAASVDGGVAAQDGACGEEPEGLVREAVEPMEDEAGRLAGRGERGERCGVDPPPSRPGRSAPDSTIARTTEVRTNGRPPETRLITACASSGIRPIIDVTRSRVATSSNGRSSTVLAFGQPGHGMVFRELLLAERRHHGHVPPGRSRQGPIVRRP